MIKHDAARQHMHLGLLDREWGQANRDKAVCRLATNAIPVTSLYPAIGYQTCADASAEALAANLTRKNVVVEKGNLAEREAGHTLDARRMT